MMTFLTQRLAQAAALNSKTLRVTAFSGLFGLLAACNGQSDNTTVSSAPTLSSISVTPAAPSMAAGLTEQLTATGIYSDGSKKNVSQNVTWSSSSPLIATVNTAGLATAVASGSAAMNASLSGVSGTTTLTVTAASLIAIGITPAAPSVANGSTESFSATGVFTDNSTHDLSSTVTWASSNTTVVSISNTADSAGLATTLMTGKSSIMAMANGISSPGVTLTVTAATLVSISVTPAAPSIALGTTKAFTATGTFTDHSTQDLSSRVTWSAATAGVASIGNTAGSYGQARGLGQGTSAIIASVNGLSSSAATLTVTAATLASIAITPPNPSIALGTAQHFMATGTYTDNTVQILTAAATWTSSDTSVATISNGSGSDGLASSVKVGSVSITAHVGTVTSTAVTLNVTAATLVSIAVTPLTPSVTLGMTQQFTAAGTFTDNSTQDLTSAVTWASATASVASISNAAGSQGQATSLATGTTNMTAALGLVVSPADLLTVANPVWNATGRLTTARDYHTSTPLLDGTVLVAGGYNSSSGILSSAEIYTPSTGTWSTTASLTAARYQHTATLLLDGTVLVAGGYSSSGPLSSAEIY